MNDDQPQGNPWIKSLLVWGGIFLALLLVVSMFGSRGEPSGTMIRYSDFRAKVAEGSVRDVQIGPERITGSLKNDQISLSSAGTPLPGMFLSLPAPMHCPVS